MHLLGDFTLLADASDSGSRLDVVVSMHIRNCSRSQAAALIRRGCIRVNGSEKKTGYTVREGDEIGGTIQPPEDIRFDPEPIPLDVLYEDDEMLIINKQPGLVVHPAPGHYTGTLLNGLLYRFPELESFGERIRAGIVHRLDKDTSGTMVIAKTIMAHESLSRQFKNRTIQKKYMALVAGAVKKNSGKITFPIGRHPVDRKKMSIISTKGRHAETHWKVKERFAEATLLEMDLKTGRTHQIRAHCAAIHHPVIGDPVYGGKKSKNDPSVLASAKRQMLHSWRLTLDHPGKKKEMRFESPMPPDMREMIGNLVSPAV